MARKNDFTLDQATTFVYDLPALEDANNAPIDLSSYTGTSQMRKSPTSSTAYTFQVAAANTGVITLSMTYNVTSKIKPGRYLYDVKLVSGNTVVRAYEGVVTVTPSITK